MIYDITPVISERLQVWPGDTPVSRRVLLDMKRGDNLTLSSLCATVHLVRMPMRRAITAACAGNS